MSARQPVVRINRPCPRPVARRPGAGSGGGPRLAPALRVGLLGGSFNPPHEGHRAISLEAMRRLRLDRVMWLVSPQNPLKATAGMARFQERMRLARQVAGHPRLVVSDLEERAGTRYTVETIRHLQRDRRTRFVWLIGADNLVQLPLWRRWQELVGRVPIAVFDREPYAYRGLAGKVARRFAAARLPEARAASLATTAPPAWVYLRFRRHCVSSTALRERRAGDAASGE